MRPFRDEREDASVESRLLGTLWIRRTRRPRIDRLRGPRIRKSVGSSAETNREIELLIAVIWVDVSRIRGIGYRIRLAKSRTCVVKSNVHCAGALYRWAA